MGLIVSKNDKVVRVINKGAALLPRGEQYVTSLVAPLTGVTVTLRLCIIKNFCEADDSRWSIT